MRKALEAGLKRWVGNNAVQYEHWAMLVLKKEKEILYNKNVNQSSKITVRFNSACCGFRIQHSVNTVQYMVYVI
jgi:hypothetical protein